MFQSFTSSDKEKAELKSRQLISSAEDKQNNLSSSDFLTKRDQHCCFFKNRYQRLHWTVLGSMTKTSHEPLDLV